MSATQENAKDSPFGAMIPAVSSIPGSFIPTAVPGSGVFNPVAVPPQPAAGEKPAQAGDGRDAAVDIALQGRCGGDSNVGCMRPRQGWWERARSE